MFGNEISIPESLLITLVSMTVVFIVLLCISYLIDLTYTYISMRSGRSREPAANGKPVGQPGGQPGLPPGAQAGAPHGPAGTDEARKAILAAAAIAAYLGRSTDSLVVRSIRRIPDTESAWSKTNKVNLNQE